MADNFQTIVIPANVWSDIYALSGIAVGKAIWIENVGDSDVFLAVQALQPSPDHKAYNILRRGGCQMRNSQGDLGAWAFCHSATARIAVREA